MQVAYKLNTNELDINFFEKKTFIGVKNATIYKHS